MRLTLTIRLPVGPRRPGLRQPWLVGMLLVHAVWWSGCGGQVCTEEEQAVFAEFPQYGGLRVVPEGNPDSGACAAYYQTADPPNQVQQYFVDGLRARGWTIEQQLDLDAGQPAGGDLVRAQRGPFSYVVLYESLEEYLTPRPGTHVAAHVSKQ